MASFYENGLAFECARCSNCCRHESGLVLLSKVDLEALCRTTNLSEENFLLTYCRIVNYNSTKHVSLIEKENNDCIFWQDGCTVYNGRPLQCRSYPFWDRLLQGEAWLDEAKSCAGIGQGEKKSKEIIENFKQKRDNEPLIVLQND